MHEDKNEFDLAVKAILEDGREEVPDRVWASVASKLPRRAASPLWLAAGWAFVAAVLALGIIFTGILPGHGEGIGSDSGALADSHAAYRRSDQSVTPDETLSEDIADQTVSFIPIRENSILTAEAVPQTHDGLAAPAAEEEGSGSRNATGGKASKASSESGARMTDPFALMAFEDAHKAAHHSRPALVVTGILGSNDGSAKDLHALKVLSSGAYTPKVHNGISESSESIFSVPVSLGLGVRLPIGGKWSLGTGVTASLLERSFTGTYTDEGEVKAEKADIRHSMVYIGIPLNLYYDIWEEFNFHIYAFAGGQIEKGISNKYYISAAPTDMLKSDPVEGFQYSASLGMGMRYDITDHIGIYLDPSARFYFDSGQPKSIRTKKPLMFNFEAGIRFDL